MTTVALIPSYQPNVKLVSLVACLRACGIAGVVVDDGSGERYRPVFKTVRRYFTVIGYGRNRGKGHALKSGLRFIQSNYPDDTVVVTVDADGQHDPIDVLRCANEASATQDSMVLGCRNFDGEGVPLRSRLGNILTRGVYRIASGVGVSDTQTGLRAFPASLIGFLMGVAGERYEYEMNVLLACPAHHVTIREVPIHTIYEKGNASSHFRTVRDSIRIYRGILAFVASSLVSFLIDYTAFGVLSILLAGLGTVGLGCANVGARLLSSTANFLINRNIVFRSAENLYVTAVRYALLALGILAGNTLAMIVLVSILAMPALLAKLLVEVSFFIFSWALQNRVVFAGRSSS